MTIVKEDLHYRICRLDEKTGEEILLAACYNMGVATEIAKAISRTIWQGYRIAIFFGDEDLPSVSFKK